MKTSNHQFMLRSLQILSGAALLLGLGCDEIVDDAEHLTVEREGTQQQFRSGQALRVASVVLSPAEMDQLLEWKSKGMLSDVHELGEAFAELEGVDCWAAVTTPDVSNVTNISDDAHKITGWREGVSTKFSTEHKIDNRTASQNIGGHVGASSKVDVRLSTHCNPGVDATDIIPKLSVHSSYYGTASLYAHASTHGAGTAKADLQFQGVVASNVTDYDTEEVLLATASKSVEAKISSEAKTEDWIKGVLIDLVNVAKDYGKTYATVPGVGGVDPDPDGPPDLPVPEGGTTDEVGKNTSFGSRLIAALDTAGGKKILDDMADIAIKGINGLTHQVDRKSTTKPVVLNVDQERGRLEPKDSKLKIGNTYRYRMHVEYKIVGDVSVHHPGWDPLKTTRQHAHVTTQVVDDFLFAGVIGFEDTSGNRIGGAGDAWFAVVGAQPPYGNTSVSYPVPAEANWSDDVAVDPPGLYDSFELQGASSERTFNELGRSLQTFFDTVWLADPDAVAYQSAKNFADQVKAKTSREYANNDAGKSPSDGNGVNVIVGQGGTPHGCASIQ